MSQLVTPHGPGAPDDVGARVPPGGVAAAEIGDVIASLPPATGTAACQHDRADPAANASELVRAATRQVFAPDPLADPVVALTDLLPVAEPAAAAAAEAAVEIRAADTHVDVAAAVRTLDAVFAPGAGHHFYPPSLVRNLLAAGAPVLLAWEGARAIGVLLAVPGWTADGRPMVQSGPMAVLPSARGRGASVALKLAQRAWALQRGVTEIRWTFDAMAAVNASLNLCRLGVTVQAFLPGYEGLRDNENPLPLPYDRLLVSWQLIEPAGSSERGDVGLRPGGVEPVWAVAAGRDGLPMLNLAWSAAEIALVAVPPAISALRRDDPALASAWQHAVGPVLREALAAGWHVGWDRVGAYRLTAPGTPLSARSQGAGGFHEMGFRSLTVPHAATAR